MIELLDNPEKPSNTIEWNSILRSKEVLARIEDLQKVHVTAVQRMMVIAQNIMISR